jgi:mycoredoxin
MKIRMYTTDWCGDCHRAKKFFKEKNISFDEINIERSRDALRQLVAWTGGKHIVPTFEFKGKVLINPPIKELAAALDVPY